MKNKHKAVHGSSLSLQMQLLYADVSVCICYAKLQLHIDFGCASSHDWPVVLCNFFNIEYFGEQQARPAATGSPSTAAALAHVATCHEEIAQ